MRQSILPNNLSGKLSTFFRACFRFGFFIFAMDVFYYAFHYSLGELSLSNHSKRYKRDLNL